MKIGVFLPNWIGDVVMATPTLRALRSHYGPQGEIVGIMRPYVADVLAGTTWLNQSLLYDPRSQNRDLRSYSLIKNLRSLRLDQVILLTNSFRTGLLAWLSGARDRVGYARYGRGWMLTRKLAHRREAGRYLPTPVLDDYLRLASALGCREESPRMELATLPQDEQAADAVWHKHGWKRDEPIAVLNSGGAFGAAKLWPSEYFAELARKIANELEMSVLVLCGPNEREIAGRIVQRAAHPRVVGLHQESQLWLGLTKACVRRARVMVTTDSGPRHFASAFGVPSVALFGPTHVAWSDTHDPRSILLQHEVPCGPCQKRVCPLVHHRCMRDLGVETVYEAVRRQTQTAHAPSHGEKAA